MTLSYLTPLKRAHTAQGLLFALLLGSLVAGWPVLALMLTVTVMFALKGTLPKGRASHKVMAAVVLSAVATAGMLLTRAAGADCGATFAGALCLFGVAGFLAEHP